MPVGCSFLRPPPGEKEGEKGRRREMRRSHNGERRPRGRMKGKWGERRKENVATAERTKQRFTSLFPPRGRGTQKRMCVCAWYTCVRVCVCTCVHVCVCIQREWTKNESVFSSLSLFHGRHTLSYALKLLDFALQVLFQLRRHDYALNQRFTGGKGRGRERRGSRDNCRSRGLHRCARRASEEEAVAPQCLRRLILTAAGCGTDFRREKKKE